MSSGMFLREIKTWTALFIQSHEKQQLTGELRAAAKGNSGKDVPLSLVCLLERTRRNVCQKHRKTGFSCTRESTRGTLHHIRHV